ncbi:RNA-binding transcriptional accessory protein [Pueribacillus theae]|uniref:RNA-binding transcriptional accessory protein n=1 Tax=Pueribacillus theae TaxID=2171751 RepID=A0A2U1JP73_9BACI|nr:Tex family protein [Pueribacillus theae]PWA06976.1 RNA-binding transcriptional accessory protein [Pueribacillus theae]
MPETLHPEIMAHIANELNIKESQVKNVLQLLQEGNTVPFIARYRKELTGGLDEVVLREISENWTYAVNLDNRKQEVIRLIDEQGKLTDELKLAIEKSKKLQEVEDLYRPYKQKRRTKATAAKEKGLEPLAEWLFALPSSGDVETEAKKYLSEEHELHTVEDALQGAKDIIAEWISDHAEFRKWIRTNTYKKGKLQTSGKDVDKDEKKTYQIYYDYEEMIEKIVPHRVLAINRGEKDGVLKTKIVPPTEEILTYLNRQILTKQTIAESCLKEAIEDSFKRLIEPSIEREIRGQLTEKAEEQAIHIFSENLKHLLLQPPLKGNVVLGIDPAYRTGCKLAVVDETGKVLKISVIYPTPPRSEIEKAKKIVNEIIEKYGVQIIAIGNGTASRETEQFVADVIKENGLETKYVIVNEAGASVYSASSLAREEFPNLQTEERSAVSIARRLQDPLAELVKIDPKSVGVGQYQHDVSQKRLNDSLTFIVETVVNRVGVNVNTASVSLLQYVAGLSKAVAKNIVKKREDEGGFSTRMDLKKIPRLGAKTYEQCIGFLRIPNGKNKLDQTPIHPESYKDAKRLLEAVGLEIDDIGTSVLKEKLENLQLSEMAQSLEIGEPTLKDMIDALIRPSRDPRDEIAKPILKSDVLKMEDLKKGMQLEGTIRNVVDFGAFVDIGVKQDGLVHISKLANRFVKHPLDVVKLGDVVTVWIEDVDLVRERIALTMLAPEQQLN